MQCLKWGLAFGWPEKNCLGQYRYQDISVLEISVLNNKNNFIEFKNFLNFFLHVDIVYFGTK